ncbi:hypothetical protein [Erwinia sp. V71]|uniref:hypothetical protein n=1 Tax=Erwinia sp. V71 TaxID=3369424 RepID=UPI003F5EDD9D
MIHRFTLTAVAAVFALTGCAKPVPTGPVADFASGNTLVTVTHVPAPTEDGTTVFVTIDGNDAGALEKGGNLTLSVPAGSHEIGGYARSLIGRVTISPVKVTTDSESVKHVVYTVTKSKPEFLEQKSSPVAKQPAKQEAQPAAQPQETQSTAQQTPQQDTSSAAQQVTSSNTQQTQEQTQPTQAVITAATPEA